MVNNNKTNDWFTTLLFNPDKNYDNFKQAGLDGNNTGLQDRGFYRNTNKVQDTFKDDKGNFNEVAFNQFYDSAQRTYNKFVQNDLETNFLKDYKASSMDIHAPKGVEKTKDLFFVQEVKNPMSSSAGVTSLFGRGQVSKSAREIGQANKVWDYDRKTWLDYTPNSSSVRGLNFIFSKPLVMAAWDEDGEHKDEDSGRVVKHKKGEYKLNKDGAYYYETLGNRSSLGKDLLHLTDTLTVDGSKWNKYDIFDSDGLEKSVGGSVAKLLFQVAPYAIPYVRNIYAGTVAATQLSEALSVLGQSFIDLKFGDSKAKPQIYNTLRDIDSFAKKFEMSTSDEGRNSMVNFEMATGMVADIVGQLYQQRVVAQIPRWLGVDKKTMNIQRSLIAENSPRYLKKYGETLESAIAKGSVQDDFLQLFNNQTLKRFSDINAANANLASNMSQYYMALTQSQGIYETMKENGFSDESIAAGTIGAVFGFKKIFASELGNVALRGLGLEGVGKVTQRYFRELSEEMGKRTSLLVGSTPAAKASFINKVSNGLQSFYKKAVENPNILIQQGSKEMLEEMSEEALQDAIVGSAAILEKAFRSLSPGETGNTYNWMDSNPLARYLMAGAGGFVGGTIFEGINKLENTFSGALDVNKNLPEDVRREIQTLVRNGATDQLLKEVENIVKKGKTGVSTTLSTRLAEDGSNDGEFVFESAKNRQDSQNDMLGNVAKGYIMAIDAAINGQGAGYSDEDLMSKALSTDLRLQQLQKESGIDLKIYEDYAKNLDKLVEAKTQLDKLQESDADRGKWTSSLNEAKQNIEDITTGKRTGEYAERLAFFLNRSISDPFIKLDITTFALSKGINFNSANEKTKDLLQKEFQSIQEGTLDWDETSFKVFKKVREMSNPEILKYANNEIFDYEKEFQEVFKEPEKELSEQELEEVYTKYLGGRSYNQFFKEFNLNPNNLSLTEEQKKEITKSYIAHDTSFNLKNDNGFLTDVRTKVLNKWLQTAFNANLESGNKIGIDQIIALKNKQQLQDFLNKVETLGNRFGYVDTRTSKAIKKLINANNQIDVAGTLKNIFTRNPDELRELIENSFSSNIEGSKFGFKAKDENGLMSFFNINTELKTLEHGQTELIYKLQKDDSDFDGDIVTEPKILTIAEVIDLVLSSIDGNNVDAGYKTTTNTVEELIGNDHHYSGTGSMGVINKLKDHLLLNEADRISMINQAKAVTQNVLASPIYDSLSKLSKSLIGEDIFQILKEEENRYENFSNITDYVFSNRFREKQFKQADTVLRLFQSAMLASTKADSISGQAQFDFNDIINHYNRANSLPEYGVITEQAYNTVSKDLTDIQDQIGFLSLLDVVNNGSKFSESEKTQTRMNTLFTKLFTGTSGDSRYDDALRQILIKNEDDSDTALFDNVLSNEEEIAIENYYENGSNDPKSRSDSESILNRIEHSLYERFAKQSPEVKEKVIKQLMEITDYESPVTTLIRKNTEILDNVATGSPATGLNPKFITNYIISILSTDTYDFKNKFKKELIDPNVQYAPFHNQVITLRMAYAMMENKELFQLQLANLKGDTKKYFAVQSDLAEKYESYKNLFAVYGQPGSGKTTSIAWFINQMAKAEGKKVISAAPTATQSKKLASLLGHPKSYSKTQLFEHLLTEEGMKKYESMTDFINTNKGNATLLKNTEPFKDNTDFRKYDKNFLQATDIQSELPDIIIIDEFTHFNVWEMQMIDSLSDDITIIALGDSRQQGFNSDGEGLFPDGEFFISTPELIMSIRSNNIHKKDNLEVLSTMVRNLDNILTNNIKGADISQMFQNQKSMIQFKYWEETDGNKTQLNGDKFASSVSKEYLLGLVADLDENEKIALITDQMNSELANTFNEILSLYPNKVEIRSSDDVQGQEFKYTIVDVTFSPIKVAGSLEITNLSTLNFLREFYTLVTRSSNGTIIIDKTNGEFDSSYNQQVDYTSDIGFEADDILNFKNTYIDILINSLPAEAQTEEATPEIPSTVTIPEPAPSEEKEKEVTVESGGVDPNILEPTDKEKFFKENTTIWSFYNHYSLVKDGSNYVGSKLNEDLGAFNFTEDQYSDHVTALATMKSLFLKTKGNGVSVSPNTLRSLRISNKIRPFLSKYFNNDSDSLYNKAFNDKSSGFRIKVSKKNDYNKSFNSVNTKNYKPANSNEFARLVYSIHLGEGKFLDITMGALLETNLMKNDGLRNAIKGLDFSNDASYYFNINKDAKFNFRNIELLTNKTEYDLSRFNEEYTLDKYLKDNPQFATSSKVLLGRRLVGKYVGSPVLLVNWDLLETNIDDNLASRFLEDFKDQNKNEFKSTQIVPLNRIGYSTEEYMRNFSNYLLTNQDSSLYAAYMLSAKLIASVAKYHQNADNFTTENFAGMSAEEISKLRDTLGTFIKEDFDRNLLQSSFIRQSGVGESVNNLITFINDPKNEELLAKMEFDESKISVTKTWNKIYNKVKNSKNIYKALDNIIEELNNGTSSIKGITADELTYVKTKLNDFDKKLVAADSTTFIDQANEETTLTHGNGYRMIKDGVVVRISRAYDALEIIANRYNGLRTTQGITTDNFKQIIDQAVEQSGFFPNGIYLEARVLGGSPISDEFWYDPNPLNKFYLNAPLQMPRIYMNYDNVELNPIRISENSREVVESIQQSELQKMSEMTSQIRENLLTLPSLVGTAFEAEYNSYIDSLSGSEDTATILSRINSMIKNNWVNRFETANGKLIVYTNDTKVKYENGQASVNDSKQLLKQFLGNKSELTNRNIMNQLVSIEGLSNDSFYAIDTNGNGYNVTYNDSNYSFNKVTPPMVLNLKPVLDAAERVRILGENSTEPYFKETNKRVAEILKGFEQVYNPDSKVPIATTFMEYMNEAISQNPDIDIDIEIERDALNDLLCNTI